MIAKPPISTNLAEPPDSDPIFRRYAAKLEAIAVLDRAYYAIPSPGLVERAEYYERQAVLERERLRLYAELERVRQRAGQLPTSPPS